MISIYILINPINQHIFYVGATYNPEHRLKCHCSQLYNTFKGNVIWDLLQQGLKPEMVVVDTVTYAEAAEAENFYIGLFKMYGFYLPQTSSNYSGNKLSSYARMLLENNIPFPVNKRMASIKAKKRRELKKLYPERYMQ